ncbi:MAG: phosphoglycerate kinase, partial [Betaproteobacteria bacterium]|nr:phosphoglycerate kinase [Betaproteobacteria bacterium]
MEQLWHEKMQGWDDPDRHDDDGVDFNGVELELTRDDIDRLEDDVLNSRLPATQGFFFGVNSDDHYREQDLEFCRRARAELFLGLKVFY